MWYISSVRRICTAFKTATVFSDHCLVHLVHMGTDWVVLCCSLCHTQTRGTRSPRKRTTHPVTQPGVHATATLPVFVMALEVNWRSQQLAWDVENAQKYFLVLPSFPSHPIPFFLLPLLKPYSPSIVMGTLSVYKSWVPSLYADGWRNGFHFTEVSTYLTIHVSCL